MQVVEPSFLQRLLRILPSDLPLNKNVFVHDFHRGFASILFYGSEASLLLFDVLLFCTVNMCAQPPCRANMGHARHTASWTLQQPLNGYVYQQYRHEDPP